MAMQNTKMGWLGGTQGHGQCHHSTGALTVIAKDIPESETVFKIFPSYKKVYGFIIVFLMAYGNN